MCFGIRISSPIHPTTLTIPIQNKKCLKNAKKCIRGQQFSPCHLKCSRDFVVFTNAFTGSPKQFCVCRHCYPSTTDEQYKKRAQGSPFFFFPSHPIPFTNFRGAGLSEEHCLWVIVMFHFLSHLIFRVHCCGEAESTGSPFVMWYSFGHKRVPI